jgi:hypothetical protein
MNFEEIERNTAKHIIKYFTNVPLNTDYTCLWCYPPPAFDTLKLSFQNFWKWFQLAQGAETYSAKTIVTFNLFEHLNNTPISEHRNTRLQEVIVKLLTSIRYKNLPLSSDILYFFIQGVAFETNCFQQSVNYTIALKVYGEILDQNLLQLQKDRLQVQRNQQLLREIIDSSIPSIKMNQDQFTALINQFTTSLDVITNQMNRERPRQAPRETNLVPVRRFSGKAEEDPNDWLIHFEKAAKANNWAQDRSLEIVGGFLDGIAADWYEDNDFNSWNDPEEVDDDDNNNNQPGPNTFVAKFLDHFSTIEQQNRWHYELNEILQGKDEKVESYAN